MERFHWKALEPGEASFDALVKVIGPARALFDLAGVAFVAIHSSHRIAVTNRALCRSLGWTEEELFGQDWFETAIPEAQRAQVAEAFELMMGGHISPVEHYENDVLTKTGETRRFAWHNDLLCATDGSVVGTLSLGRDIEEEYRQQKCLRQERDALEVRVEERTALLRQANEVLRVEMNRREQAEQELRIFAQVFQKAQIGLLVYELVDSALSQDFVLREANPAGAALFHLPMPQALGCPILGLPEPTESPERLASLREMLHTGVPLNLETSRNPVVRSSSTPGAWVSGEAFPLTTRLVGLCYRDVTFRKLAEEKKKEQAEALVRSNLDLEQFAYVASHDLQEPLRKIQAFGERLADRLSRTALDEDSADYLRRMQSATGRMQVLINDLLSYSRVTTRGQPFRRIELGTIATDVLMDLETRVQDSGATIELGPLPSIEADPLQMGQLFQNLIGNALKFHAPDRPPLVRILALPCDHKQDCERKGWELRFEDNGIGFEERYATRIFEPFQRLHGRGSFEGTGIGLAICHKIVQRHHGVIVAESRHGIGSVFRVRLPETQETESSHP